nr:unnamed protein product [Callosobruchus chinensis]
MMFLLLLTFLHTSKISAMDNLNVAFRWKVVDFEFPNDTAREDAITKGIFKPENNLPLGLEVYEDRMFISVPRWKSGVAASLNYIKLTDSKESPKLRPYPSWEYHDLTNLDEFGMVSQDKIVSPFRIRADSCGRLWVMDTGIADILEGSKVLSKPKLLIFDLNTDTLIRSYQIPEDQVKKDVSFFANIAVEENGCEDTYAYLADLGHPGLVVYSFKKNRSWLVKHHYFHISPTAGEMTVAGITFQWADGIFGLALSKPDESGYSTLYFHPMHSFHEFTVSTKLLRDEAMATDPKNFHEYKVLGSRGPKAQSGASFLHQKTNVLFYALVNLNAVACWRTTNPNYTMESQGRVFMSNETMVFPNDIKVDANDTLWVMSDKLPVFMYEKLNPNEYNFRILNSTVADAIRGTACDSKMVMNPSIVKNITKNITRTISTIVTAGSSTINAQIIWVVLSFVAVSLLPAYQI